MRTLLKTPERVALCICCFNMSSRVSSSLRLWLRVFRFPGAGFAELFDDMGVSNVALTGGDSEEPWGDTDGVEAVDVSGTIAVPFPQEVSLFGGMTAVLVKLLSQFGSGGDDSELLIAMLSLWF